MKLRLAKSLDDFFYLIHENKISYSIETGRSIFNGDRTIRVHLKAEDGKQVFGEIMYGSTNNIDGFLGLMNSLIERLVSKERMSEMEKEFNFIFKEEGL